MADPKKPAEPKKSFAESLLKQGTEPAEADDDAKKGFTKEWQPAAQAFNLRLWFKDGRHSESLSWTFYSGDEWHDGPSGKPEQLTLSFGTRVITVDGYNLRTLLAQIDECHLKSIREHDSKEVALIRSEPMDDNGPKAAIMRIEVEPPFEELVKDIKEGD